MAFYDSFLGAGKELGGYFPSNPIGNIYDKMKQMQTAAAAQQMTNFLNKVTPAGNYTQYPAPMNAAVNKMVQSAMPAPANAAALIPDPTGFPFPANVPAVQEIAPSGFPFPANIPALTEDPLKGAAPTGDDYMPVAPEEIPPEEVVERDLAKELALLDELGLTGKQAEEMDLMKLYEAVYSPEELAKMPDYQKAKQAFDQAKANLLATPRPTNTMLRGLENALREKSDVGQQLKTGDSELFKQAGIETTGISGYATLRENIAQKSKEMQDRYGSFVNTISNVGGAMADTYNILADQYQVALNDFDREQAKLDKVIDHMYRLDESMQLAEQQAGLQIKTMALQNYYNEQSLEKQAEINQLNWKFQNENPSLQDRVLLEEAGMALIGDKIVPKGSYDYIFKTGTSGGWCGVDASYWSTAEKVGNYWTDKRTHIDDKNPTAGDKLLVPLGVASGINPWGHVATVIDYNPDTGDILVTESNRDGAMTVCVNNGGTEAECAKHGKRTIGTYNVNQLQKDYGDDWGVVHGDFRPGVMQEIQGLQQEVGIDMFGEQGQEIYERTWDIKNNYQKYSDEFKDIQGAYGRILAAARTAAENPAGDLAIIFNYMKMLDPRSIVRESEFETAQTAGSIVEGGWNKFYEANKGTRLNETRGNFIRMAQDLYVAALKDQNNRMVEAYNMADQFGVPRDYLQIPNTVSDYSDIEQSYGLNTSFGQIGNNFALQPQPTDYDFNAITADDIVLKESQGLVDYPQMQYVPEGTTGTSAYSQMTYEDLDPETQADIAEYQSFAESSPAAAPPTQGINPKQLFQNIGLYQ